MIEWIIMKDDANVFKKIFTLKSYQKIIKNVLLCRKGKLIGCLSAVLWDGHAHESLQIFLSALKLFNIYTRAVIKIIIAYRYSCFQEETSHRYRQPLFHLGALVDMNVEWDSWVYAQPLTENALTKSSFSSRAKSTRVQAYTFVYTHA